MNAVLAAYLDLIGARLPPPTRTAREGARDGIRFAAPGRTGTRRAIAVASRSSEPPPAATAFSMRLGSRTTAAPVHGTLLLLPAMSTRGRRTASVAMRDEQRTYGVRPSRPPPGSRPLVAMDNQVSRLDRLDVRGLRSGLLHRVAREIALRRARFVVEAALPTLTTA